MITQRLPRDGVWKIDPRRSTVGFAVKQFWGLSTVRGVFQTCAGTWEVRAHDAAGELAIETCSVETGNPRRDQHLRSQDFLDVEHHPRIAFRALSAGVRDTTLTVAGELAIRSHSVPLAIPVELKTTSDGALCVSGSATVAYAATGLRWNRLGMIRDPILLYARLTLTREGMEPPNGRRSRGVP
jgi:polyisoprenoid-binding protein YceI